MSTSSFSFLHTAKDTFDTIIESNLKAPIIFQIIAQIMIDKGNGGYIVNTASTTGIRPVDKVRVYSMSKAFFIMTKVMALTLGQHKIRVNAVC